MIDKSTAMQESGSSVADARDLLEQVEVNTLQCLQRFVECFPNMLDLIYHHSLVDLLILSICFTYFLIKKASLLQ